MQIPNVRIGGDSHICVLHIIVGLDVGGAEMMLKRLVNSFADKAGYRHIVVSLTSVGAVGVRLQFHGIEVHSLDMRSSLSVPLVLFRLVRLIRSIRPDIVQTWMYHADLLGGLAARLAGNRHVIWGIRGSAIPQSGISTTQVVVSTCSWMSYFLPKVIVCCAESARIAHIEKGYDRNRMVVIPNGYELAYFDRNIVRRVEMRNTFGFNDNDVIVGIVGRYDTLKDHKNFVLAATRVASKVNHVRFLMVGRGVDSTNEALVGLLEESGVADRFVLVGERDDVPDCLDAMDIFCLSSFKEGFPNVVCEAMAMSLPCVVTDAGDAAEIVADTGIVVEPRNSVALAGALQTMICFDAEERLRLGRQARLRIEKYYSIEIASDRFEALYKQIIKGSANE